MESVYGAVIGAPASVEEITPLSSSKWYAPEVGGRLLDNSYADVTRSPFARGARRTDNSRGVTVLLVLNYMIGSGILNTPQTFRDSGVAATTVMYLVAGEYRAQDDYAPFLGM